MIDDPTLRAQRETAAATTGPHRIRPSPWVGPRHRSAEELQHLFPDAPARGPSVKHKLLCGAPGCEARHDFIAQNTDEALRAMATALGWHRVPAVALRFTTTPARFTGLVALLRQGLSGAISGLGLSVVPVPETNACLLLGAPVENVQFDELARQVGATLEEVRAPGAEKWCCSLSCRSNLVRSEAHAPGRLVTTTRDPPQTRTPENPNLDVKCQARGCVNTTPGVPRAKFADPTTRVKVAEDFGLFLNPDGRTFCSRTCAELSAMVEGRPMPEPVTHAAVPALKQKYGGWPESNAARIYREIHGHGPNEPAPEEPAPKPRRTTK